MTDESPNGPTGGSAEGPSPFDSGEFFAPMTRGPVAPKSVGPYEIVRTIGKGGMGVVYLARRTDGQIRQDVALKLARVDVDSEEYIRRFKQEREVLYALNHPNIARVLDGGTTEDGQPYFVMEYVEGERIDRYCDEHRLTTEDRLRLFAKVCSAIRHCHQNMVVHRDLKPGNILVTAEGEPKVLDFGIAKLLDPDLSAWSDETSPALRLMTFAYASPEQIRGEATTASTDVYSLGVLLYELLTGRMPYDLTEQVRAKIEEVICNQAPEPPSTAITKPIERRLSDGTTSTVRPEEVARLQESKPTNLKRRLSGDVDDIVMVSLAKSAKVRYASVGDLARDIEAHLDGRPVEARRLRRSVNWTVYQTRRFARRHRVTLTAGAAAVAALAIGLVLSLLAWQEAERQRGLAEASEARTRALAGALIEEVHDRVLPLPGSVTIRERLVDLGTAELEAMESRAPATDASRLLEIATGYDRMGDVAAGVRTPHRGDLDAAESAYARARDLRRRAETAGLTGVPLARALAESDLRLGDIERERGRNAEAIARYEAAIDRLDNAGALDTDARVLAARVRVALASVLGRTAEVAAGEERGGGALLQRRVALLDAAVADLRDIVAREPTPERRNELARALHDRGEVGFFRGAFAEAAPHFEAAITIRSELFASRPTDAYIRSRLAVSQMLAGRSLVALGRVEEGERLLERARDHFEFLVEADPNDERARQQLGAALEVIGAAFESIDPDRAVEALAAAVREGVAITRAHGDSIPGHRLWAYASYRIGRIETARSAWEAALAALDTAAAGFRTLVGLGGADAEYADRAANVARYQLHVVQHLTEEVGPGDPRLEWAMERLRAVERSMGATRAALVEAEQRAADAPEAMSKAGATVQRCRDRVAAMLAAGPDDS
jgi:serine/threonine protein kinase/tetratricopeptide (TPR) repeat protein